MRKEVVEQSPPVEMVTMEAAEEGFIVMIEEEVCQTFFGLTNC